LRCDFIASFDAIFLEKRSDAIAISGFKHAQMHWVVIFKGESRKLIR